MAKQGSDVLGLAESKAYDALDSEFAEVGSICPLNFENTGQLSLVERIRQHVAFFEYNLRTTPNQGNEQCTAQGHAGHMLLLAWCVSPWSCCRSCRS